MNILIQFRLAIPLLGGVFKVVIWMKATMPAEGHTTGLLEHSKKQSSE